MAVPFYFQYIVKDGQLLRAPAIIALDPKKMIIKGAQEMPVFDPVKIGFFNMGGFWVEQNGVEYGSITMSEAAIADLLVQGNCQRPRIHVNQFVTEFV